MIEDDAAAQRQAPTPSHDRRPRSCRNPARCRRGYCAPPRPAGDLVVADPHADDRAQPRKALDVLGCHRIAHDHQPVDLGAIGRVEFGEGFGLRRMMRTSGPKISRSRLVIRDLPFLGVEHRHRHLDSLARRATFTGWWSAAEWTIASKAATPCRISSAVIG